MRAKVSPRVSHGGKCSHTCSHITIASQACCSDNKKKKRARGEQATSKSFPFACSSLVPRLFLAKLACSSLVPRLFLALPLFSQYRRERATTKKTEEDIWILSLFVSLFLHVFGYQLPDVCLSFSSLNLFPCSLTATNNQQNRSGIENSYCNSYL